MAKRIRWGRTRRWRLRLADFADWIVGKDPRDINGIWYHMYLHSRFPGGSVINAAISGIDHALWDISGKAAGQPVYRMLGGKCRDRIRVYQSCGGATPEACAAERKSARRKIRLHRPQDVAASAEREPDVLECRGGCGR